MHGLEASPWWGIIPLFPVASSLRTAGTPRHQQQKLAKQCPTNSTFPTMRIAS